MFTKRNWLRSISVLLPLFCLTECETDPPVPVSEGCYDFPLPEGEGFSYGYKYEGTQFSYLAPCFNPNNPNEIVYVKGDADKSQLRKRNLSTGEDTYLADDIWEHPDWGSNDWILFNHADNHIWKIKSNGDSLTQLTFNWLNVDAVWSPDGQEIAFRRDDGISDNLFIIADKNAIPLDTIEGIGLKNGSWSNDDKIASSMGALNNHGVAFVDISTNEINQITSNIIESAKDIVCCMDWFSDSDNILWGSGNGLFKTNIVTGQTTKLQDGCDSKTYLFPSVSSDGRIIVGRTDQTLIKGETIYIEANLFVMDADGSNETRIEF